MDWARIAGAVIPCRDEAQTIADVVRGVKAVLSKVVVVDDGSSDGTASEAAGAGAEVVRLGVNRGKGAALAVGLARLLEMGYEWGLVLDGDGQHNPAQAPRFFAAVERESARLVVGNRMAEAGQMPWLRLLVNRVMSRLISAGCGQSLPDTQCGFRLVQLGSWQMAGLRAERYQVESEWLVEFLARGWPVAFVPVSAVYKTGASKIHPVVDTVRWLQWLLRSRSRLEEARAQARQARACKPRA